MPAGASAARLLVAEGLGCTVDGRRLFADVSFAASAGDLLEVRGPNGSGKSTLLRGLAGLRAFHSGRVETFGLTAYVGHKSGMSERLTPLENMRWLLRLQGLQAAPAELDEAFSRMGLGAARFDPCGTLSAGQLRRAAFARLLLCRADVWLLDEPMTAMDAAGTALVQRMIAEHRAAGGAAVCATHRTLEAAEGALSEGARGACPSQEGALSRGARGACPSQEKALCGGARGAAARLRDARVVNLSQPCQP